MQAFSTRTSALRLQNIQSNAEIQTGVYMFSVSCYYPDQHSYSKPLTVGVSKCLNFHLFHTNCMHHYKQTSHETKIS